VCVVLLAYAVGAVPLALSKCLAAGLAATEGRAYFSRDDLHQWMRAQRTEGGDA
jgi:hypothetical protein